MADPIVSTTCIRNFNPTLVKVAWWLFFVTFDYTCQHFLGRLFDKLAFSPTFSCQKYTIINRKYSKATHALSYEKAAPKMLVKLTSGVNLTKLFFFGNREFFRFSLISLTISQEYIFFPFLQPLKLNSETRKTGKMKVW